MRTVSTARDGATDAAARILRTRIGQGRVQPFPEVFQVVGAQGSLQVSQVLLWTLSEDQKGMSMRQVDEFGEQGFLCSDLSLEEAISYCRGSYAAAEELYASFPCLLECRRLAPRHVELDRRLGSSKEGLDVF
jgi:hypothetical protein